VKKDLALAIVDCWKKNSTVGDVPGLAAYMNEQGKFAPIKIRLQVLIGTYNRLASAALWDGQYNRAAGLLMKHCLKDKSTVVRPTKANDTHITSRRLSGDVRNPKSDWKYVK
jgi:hypothetical protein